jgi:hypothetical protein
MRKSGGWREVDGIKFISYRTGILQYARISEDGQIFVRRLAHRTTYNARIIGHGYILRDNTGEERPKAFRTETAAIIAAIKIYKKRKANATL